MIDDPNVVQLFCNVAFADFTRVRNEPEELSSGGSSWRPSPSRLYPSREDDVISSRWSKAALAKEELNRIMDSLSEYDHLLTGDGDRQLQLSDQISTEPFLRLEISFLKIQQKLAKSGHLSRQPMVRKRGEGSGNVTLN